MALTRLEISHFRNLKSLDIHPNNTLNIIIGDNAAGKTSLLESIFYLSYGRSFRNAQIKHLIQRDCDFFRLICTLEDPHTRIGLQRDNKSNKIRVNGESISRISELSTLLPVLVLHPDSHQMISAGPDFRRQFMDWGVFHVEHHFLDYWRKYRTCLKQRNAALRKHQTEKLCSLWDKELVHSGNIIKQLRCDYLLKIKDILIQISPELFPEHQIEIEYKQGWSEDIDFQQALDKNLSKDMEKGFTQIGPHRADLKITVDGQSAQSSISRGQQKKLVSLLKIAQLSLFRQSSNRQCILLFDDLPAELDQANQSKIMLILSKLNIQLFVTAIHAEDIDSSCWDDYKVFHVEHGVVQEK